MYRDFYAPILLRIFYKFLLVDIDQLGEQVIGMRNTYLHSDHYTTRGTAMHTVLVWGRQVVLAALQRILLQWI